MLLAVTPSYPQISNPSQNFVMCPEVEKMIAMLVLLILKPGAVSAGWSVTFENPNLCAVEGSSVKFGCSYDYGVGETVHKVAWYKGELRNHTWTRVELSRLPSYENRSEYLGDHQHNCTLVIHDLQYNDTGYYYFRFDTDMYGWRSKTSVYLTVSELSARVYPDSVRVGDNVTLECRTSCQLSRVVWFKDGQRVAEPEFQARAEDAGNYVCAIEGQESALSDSVTVDVQYPPLNVSAEVSYLGQLTEGSSVSLTCSSVANPPAVNYTWYRGTLFSFSSMVQVGSGQVLSIPSMEASHNGIYVCRARNQVGESNSAEVSLTVDETDINRLILLVGFGAVTLLLLTMVIIWTWRQRCHSAVDKEENRPDYENISTTYMGHKDMVTQKDVSV